MGAEHIGASGLPARMGALPLSAAPRPHAIVPQTLDDAFRLGSMIFASGLAPYSMKSKEAVCAAVMYGMEIGLPPMQAVQSIAVIGGRPTIYGDAAIALVRQSGLLASFRETIEGEGDDRAGVCKVSRLHPSGEVEEIVERFTVAMAKTAGLWDKRGRSGEATPWQLYPDRMLRARARGFALRDLFADVLKGLRIYEEAADIELQALPDREPPAPPPAAISPPTPPAPPPAEEAAPPAAAGPPAPPPEDEAPVRDRLADMENDLASATTAEAFDELAAPYLEDMLNWPMAERQRGQGIYETAAEKWGEAS
jgi:hypothetical protein